MGKVYLEIGDPPNAKGNIKVELKSVQWGTMRNTSGAGRGGSREPEVPNISDVVVTHEPDRNSSDLYKLSLSGPAKVMRIYFYDDKSKTTILTVTLEGALISGYNFSGGGGKPMESISINFTKIDWKYVAGYINENEYRPAYDLETAKGA
jgi:type VI secretion system secreted protein Hcp